MITPQYLVLNDFSHAANIGTTILFPGAPALTAGQCVVVFTLQLTNYGI